MEISMAKENDTVRTTVPVHARILGRTIPAGTQGVIVDVSRDGEGNEGYAVDFALPNADSSTEFDYDNVLLTADQFEVIPQPGADG
jgi:hypothetical protein